MDQSKGKSDRGFVADIDEVRYASKSTGELIDLLKSQVANERTVAARIMGTRTEALTVEYLLASLETEQKLYAKIEICRSLANVKCFMVMKYQKSAKRVRWNGHDVQSARYLFLLSKIY